MNRARVFRLFPTIEQEARLRQFAGAARYVFNIGLEQRRDWWRNYRDRTGRQISFASQCRELTDLRKEVDWLGEAPRSLCDYALSDLDRAMTAFFRGKRSYPRFRRADEFSAFRVRGTECRLERLNAKWGRLTIPKLGRVKVRVPAWPSDAMLAVTVARRGEKWTATATFEVDQPIRVLAGECLGVDRGVSCTLALSNGEQHRLPDSIRAVAAQRRSAQRTLARRKKGSRRRLKQRLVVAELHRRAAATRNHWLHERSTAIARRFGQVAMEKLAVANMTRAGGCAQKRGLNRSILEQGWTIFANMLAYKLEDRGGTLHLVNPAYTSQTCADCGSVNAESRKSQAVFHCVECGHRAHADTNAAINILRRSPAGVEGAGYGPVEARTGAMLTHCENLAA